MVDINEYIAYLNRNTEDLSRSFATTDPSALYLQAFIEQITTANTQNIIERRELGSANFTTLLTTNPGSPFLDEGRTNIRDWLVGSISSSNATYFLIGSGNQVWTSTQSGLQYQIGSFPLSSAYCSHGTEGALGSFIVSFGSNLIPANGSISEIGIMGLPGPTSGFGFDGVNDGIIVPSTLSLDVLGSPTQPFTIEGWIKATNYYGSTILTKARLDPNGIILTVGGGIYIGSLSCNIRKLGDNNQIVSMTGGLNDGNWHHVALIRNTDIGSWRLAVDGVLSCVSVDANACADNGRNAYTDAASGQPIRFAHAYNTTCFLAGSYDEWRVSNIARYSSNFTPPTLVFDSDSNTLALWRFDENTAGSVLDFSSNNNKGTISGASIVPGKVRCKERIFYRDAFSPQLFGSTGSEMRITTKFRIGS